MLPFIIPNFLCTTWLNASVLALSGFCIAVPLLSVLKHGCLKDSPDCHHEHPNLVPQNHAWGACFAERVHHQGIKSVEAPCTSHDELMFDYFVLVMQELKCWEERLLVSRNPVFVFVFVLLLTCVST